MSTKKFGGSNQYAQQFGTIFPEENKRVNVTGYSDSNMGSLFPEALSMTGGKTRRRSSSVSSTKKRTTKKKTTTKKTPTKKKTTKRRRSLRGGATGMEGVQGMSSGYFSNSSPLSTESQRNSIPLNTIYTPDWTNQGQSRGPPPGAAEMSVGWNEYQFGRTTPDNKFIVATGLVEKPGSLEMIGAGKKKRTTKKRHTTKHRGGFADLNEAFAKVSSHAAPAEQATPEPSSGGKHRGGFSDLNETFTELSPTKMKSGGKKKKRTTTKSALNKTKLAISSLGTALYDSGKFLVKKTGSTLKYVGKKTTNTYDYLKSKSKTKKTKQTKGTKRTKSKKTKTRK